MDKRYENDDNNDSDDNRRKRYMAVSKRQHGEGRSIPWYFVYILFLVLSPYPEGMVCSVSYASTMGAAASITTSLSSLPFVAGAAASTSGFSMLSSIDTVSLVLETVPLEVVTPACSAELASPLLVSIGVPDETGTYD